MKIALLCSDVHIVSRLWRWHTCCTCKLSRRPRPLSNRQNAPSVERLLLPVFLVGVAFPLSSFRLNTASSNCHRIQRSFLSFIYLFSTIDSFGLLIFILFKRNTFWLFLLLLSSQRDLILLPLCALKSQQTSSILALYYYWICQPHYLPFYDPRPPFRVVFSALSIVVGSDFELVQVNWLLNGLDQMTLVNSEGCGPSTRRDRARNLEYCWFGTVDRHIID